MRTSPGSLNREIDPLWWSPLWRLLRSWLLVALKLRFGEQPEPDDTKVLIVSSITDNRGNGAVLSNGAGDLHEIEGDEDGGRVGAARMQ